MPSYYPMDNMFLNIARGLVKGTTFVHKFGAVPSLSTAATGTVWDVDDTIYPWSAWDTAGTITVDRANAGDANKQVTVVGLDSNYNALQETITLTNATENASTNSFKRVFRAFLVVFDPRKHFPLKTAIRRACGPPINSSLRPLS